MSVYIACDKCEKRLKIPEDVVGRPIKCPACGSVFKADPTRVLPGKPAVEERAPVAVAPHRTAPAARADEDEEDFVPARKKRAAVEAEDEGAISPRKKKAAAVAEDEDDEDRPARAKRRAAEDDEDEIEEAEEARPGKRRTPWYVMLPLLIFSFCGAGLAALWSIGFTYLDIDRGLKGLDYDMKVWIGVGTAGAVTLLCLIFSLIPARAWLRFLLVFLFLGLGYGGSFAAIHWWNDLPFAKEEPPKPMDPNAAPGGRGGMGGPMVPPVPGGGRGRGGQGEAPPP